MAEGGESRPQSNKNEPSDGDFSCTVDDSLAIVRKAFGILENNIAKSNEAEQKGKSEQGGSEIPEPKADSQSPAPNSVDSASTKTKHAKLKEEVERRIDQTKDKIEACLKYFKELTESGSETNFSYKQALYFIFFIETFALQGAGKNDITNGLKEYVIQNWYPKKDLQLIGKVRSDLLKNPAKKISPTDFCGCIKGNDTVSSFLEKLDKFVRSVQERYRENVRFQSNLSDVLQSCELGHDIDDPEVFWAKELQDLIDKAFLKKEWPQEKDRFDFVINFNRIFKDKKLWNSKRLTDLRNNLVHEFHKYGDDEMGKEILAMRHELLRYQLAHKVDKVVCDIKPGDVWDKIEKELEKKPTICGETELVAIETKYFHGCQFSESMLPKEVSNFEKLAGQYVKFKFLTHPSKKLIDPDKRKKFEEFARLEGLRSDNTEEYEKVKEEFKKNLVTEYGVKENHFTESYEIFETDEVDVFLGNVKIEEIAKILDTLKGIRKNHSKLSNQDIISLYDRFIARKQFFSRFKYPEPLNDVAAKIKEQMGQLHKDESMRLKINDTILRVTIGEVIKDMLNIFCNAYDAYRVAFEVEDVFNDDTILDFMVQDETEEVDVAKLVDPYIKFIVPFGSKLVGPSVRAKILAKFLLLKNIPTKSSCLYREKKDKLKDELLKDKVTDKKDKDADQFNNVCKLYVDGNSQLDDEEMDKKKATRMKIKEVQVLIGGLKKDLNLPYREITYLLTLHLQKPVGRGELPPKENKNKIKINDIVSGKWGKIVLDILETSQNMPKLKDHNYMRIKKLLNIKYAAPYIVRLMREARYHEIIEKEDLKKLIGILLNENYSYIKHLGDLLSIESRDLNLYEEVCTQILKTGFNIENMLPILHEPKHVDGILFALRQMRDVPENISRHKIVELTKIFLQLLNRVVRDLMLINDTKIAWKILNGKLEDTFTRLTNDGEIEKSQVIYLKYQWNLGELRNALGREEKDNAEEAKAMHKKALEVFEEILVHNDSITHYLIISWNKAYTLKLLKDYKESHREYSNLYKQIVNHVLGKDVEDAGDTTNYRSIENSQKYKNFSAPFEGAEQNLDILYIVQDIAYTLSEQDKFAKDVKLKDDHVKNCKRALKLYEGLYRYVRTPSEAGTRECSGTAAVSEQKGTVEILAHKARIQSYTGKALFNTLDDSTDTDHRVEKCEKALKYFRDGLKNNLEVFGIRAEKDKNYRIPVYAMYFVITDIGLIASIFTKLGDESQSNQEKLPHYKKGFELREKKYDFQKRIKAYLTARLESLVDILSTIRKIRDVLPPDSKEESVYRKEFERYSKEIETLKEE